MSYEGNVYELPTDQTISNIQYVSDVTATLGDTLVLAENGRIHLLGANVNDSHWQIYLENEALWATLPTEDDGSVVLTYSVVKSALNAQRNTKVRAVTSDNTVIGESILTVSDAIFPSESNDDNVKSDVPVSKQRVRRALSSDNSEIPAERVTITFTFQLEDGTELADPAVYKVIKGKKAELSI